MTKRGKHTDSKRRPDYRSAEAEQYRPFYKTARWKRVRARQLNAEPLCRFCKEIGRITAATVCDHVDPKTKTEAFFAGPFQSLCKQHHDGEKQRIEARGYSSAVDESGWPADPRHPSNRKRPS